LGVDDEFILRSGVDDVGKNVRYARRIENFRKNAQLILHLTHFARNQRKIRRTKVTNRPMKIDSLKVTVTKP
jgi:hypothetical protein